LKKLAVIGVAACWLILALAASAVAQDTRAVSMATRERTAALDPRLPVENALRWGYSQGYNNYPSGFGGLYGDGRYPGNVISTGKGRP
jgi:hypothetical protein